MELEVREACSQFLDAWLGSGDPQTVAALFCPDVSGVGPGAEAGVQGADAVLALLAGVVGPDHTDCGCEARRMETAALGPDCGMVLAEVLVPGAGREKYGAEARLCLSCVFRRMDRAWGLSSLHLGRSGQGAGSGAAPGLEDKIGALQRMVEDKTDRLNEAINEIGILATTDKLTGVFNRMKIDQILDSELHRSERYSNPFAVVTMDLDNFKAVNEAHGYILGDYLLIHVAKLLVKRVRKTDIVGRWGGEEFFIICPETDSKAATLLAEDIRRALEESEFRGVKSLTASFGVASFESGDDRDSLVSRADQALSLAKKQGGNQVMAR